jgi:hypothetical protein
VRPVTNRMTKVFQSSRRFTRSQFVSRDGVLVVIIVKIAPAISIAGVIFATVNFTISL